MAMRLAIAAITLLCVMPAEQHVPHIRTTLSNPSVKYSVVSLPYAVLQRGLWEAIVSDNRPVDDNILPAHRAGYSGLAALRIREQPRNIFVPRYSGLNFEHIHDGTLQPDNALFEPRRAPMELRVINNHTAEICQQATPHWRLESCTRYELQPDGVLEMIFECIPREAKFTNRYVGLFWASYIDKPESLDIHFLGSSGWIRGVSESHGENAVHRYVGDARVFEHERALAERLTLLFGFSEHRYSEPWFFGVSHGMALGYVFRDHEAIRFTQSPNGGGNGNPAWDFQWYIEGPEANRRYQMVMRAVYAPYESHEQMKTLLRRHAQLLRRDGK
jgi:hypothetical protein